MELQVIQNKIHEIRGYKVILDYDLAYMYEIETAQLKRTVRRNIERFEGEDFMFELTQEELEILRCQFGTSSWGGTRYFPFAFTELGISMLSSVLNSKIAIQTNRNIMRAFVMLRHYAAGLSELNQKLETFMLKTNTKLDDNDIKVNEIYQVLKELLEHKKELEKPRTPIGFRTSSYPSSE